MSRNNRGDLSRTTSDPTAPGKARDDERRPGLQAKRLLQMREKSVVFVDIPALAVIPRSQPTISRRFNNLSRWR